MDNHTDIRADVRVELSVLQTVQPRGFKTAFTKFDRKSGRVSQSLLNKSILHSTSLWEPNVEYIPHSKMIFIRCLTNVIF